MCRGGVEAFMCVQLGPKKWVTKRVCVAVLVLSPIMFSNVGVREYHVQ